MGTDKTEEKNLLLFEKQLIEDEKSKNTREKYHRDVKAFLTYTEGKAVTRETVIGYKAYLQERYKPRSVNSVLAALNCFFGCNGRENCRVKTVKLQKQLYCPEERELTREEYERLCKAAGKKHKSRLLLLLQTLGGTGIRVSELPFITLEAVKRGEATVSMKGKTRTVFIVKALQRKLLRYAAEQNIQGGMLFVTKSGKALNRTNIWREMKKLCKAAGVSESKVFPHNLRHLFARVFYSIEKDIAKLADILGHSSIDTTRIYIISTGAEHRKRMESMRLVL